MTTTNLVKHIATIGILGRTNAGKSTLLNSLTQKKIAATTPKVNTTRKPISALWKVDTQHFLLLDAPGTCQVKSNLDRLLFNNIVSVIEISDYIWWVVDVTDPWAKDNEILANLLKRYSKPVLLLINKIDLINQDQLLTKIDFFRQKFPFVAIVPISVKKQINFINFQKVVQQYCFSPEKVVQKKTIVAPSTLLQTAKEVVREQIIFQTDDELPHQTVLVIDKWTSSKVNIYFEMTIFVATRSQKAIILGKNGHKIKRIRLSSQKLLHNLFQKTILLFLKVKVHSKWYQDLHFLQKLDLVYNH